MSITSSFDRARGNAPIYYVDSEQLRQQSSFFTQAACNDGVTTTIMRFKKRAFVITPLNCAEDLSRPTVSSEFLKRELPYLRSEINKSSGGVIVTIRGYHVATLISPKDYDKKIIKPTQSKDVLRDVFRVTAYDLRNDFPDIVKQARNENTLAIVTTEDRKTKELKDAYAIMPYSLGSGLISFIYGSDRRSH